MNAYSRWRADRYRRDEQAVINAIRMLKPSRASKPAICQLSVISNGRAKRALNRLERDAVITAVWCDGPYPRRRLYRLAPAAAPA